MKIKIEKIWEDSDDSNLVELSFSAEDDQFKTTLEFYAHSEVFRQFAEQLKDFPFSNRNVIFRSGGKAESYLLIIEVKLIDSTGRTSIGITTQDENNNSVKFESNVEVSTLTELANKLSETDFSKTTSFAWTTH